MSSSLKILIVGYVIKIKKYNICFIQNFGLKF